jgi:hypothetical protein
VPGAAGNLLREAKVNAKQRQKLHQQLAAFHAASQCSPLISLTRECRQDQDVSVRVKLFQPVGEFESAHLRHLNDCD